MNIAYRGYEIVGDGTFGMKVIKFPGRGGGLPRDLEGMFTRAVEAKSAIDLYLTKREEYENRPAPIKKVKLYPREVKTNAAESDSSD